MFKYFYHYIIQPTISQRIRVNTKPQGCRRILLKRFREYASKRYILAPQFYHRSQSNYLLQQYTHAFILIVTTGFLGYLHPIYPFFAYTDEKITNIRRNSPPTRDGVVCLCVCKMYPTNPFIPFYARPFSCKLASTICTK